MAGFLHEFRVDGLLLFFPFPPRPPRPVPAPFKHPSYVIVDWMILQEGLWTGSWFCPPSSFLKMSPPVAGHWLFSEGGRKSWYQTAHKKLSDFVPPLAVLQQRGIPAFPWCSAVHPASWRDRISQAILLFLPPHPTPHCSVELSVLITSLCFLYLIIIFY